MGDAKNCRNWFLDDGWFSGINWTAIAIMAGACLLSFIIMMYFSWDLNVMTAGEESAN